MTDIDLLTRRKERAAILFEEIITNLSLIHI